uniref:Uncharacterized protein n=1 Tax=Mycena chlorophos TaxID=658473 RepID=A0ABQ0LJB3_MYCCL|nr:predicted protein [Mycena chlorophos]
MRRARTQASGSAPEMKRDDVSSTPTSTGRVSGTYPGLRRIPAGGLASGECRCGENGLTASSNGRVCAPSPGVAFLFLLTSGSVWFPKVSQFSAEPPTCPPQHSPTERHSLAGPRAGWTVRDLQVRTRGARVGGDLADGCRVSDELVRGHWLAGCGRVVGDFGGDGRGQMARRSSASRNTWEASEGRESVGHSGSGTGPAVERAQYAADCDTGFAEAVRATMGGGSFLWSFANSDPYKASCYDCLHFFDGGKWGRHMWVVLKEFLQEEQMAKQFNEKYVSLPLLSGRLLIS